MALSFLTAKSLRIEVTDGIDLESGVFLSGERITIGSGPGDTLRLGASDIVSDHLTLIRAPGSNSWEYFSIDRGQTLVDKGNPRTGKVRPGMWFRLGSETKLEILAAVRPPESDESADSGEKKEIPLIVALPIMGLLLVGFLIFMTSIAGSGGGNSGSLRTENWFTGVSPMGPALDICLATGVQQTAASGPILVERAAPDALFRTYIEAEATSSAAAPEIRNQILQSVRKMIARAHLLAQEKQYLEASEALRRIEYVVPVGLGKCPILSAARNDLAVFELQSRRR